MTRDEFIALLPDQEARDWAAKEPGTPLRLWSRCQRGDWMLHVAGQMGVPREQLVMAACACARLALQYVAKGEERPRVAIETAEGWCRGERSLEEVRDAAYAANAAANAANAAANAANAAYAAAYAANAANAANAAYAAYAAANAAAYAAYAAYAAARQKTLLRCARIVRKLLPWRRTYVTALLQACA